MALLEIENVKIHFQITKGMVKAVDEVSFTLDEGETMGLVGESGCGKTTLAFGITRLLPNNGDIVAGQIRYDGKVIADGKDYRPKMSRRQREKLHKRYEKDMKNIRWTEISMIFQSAMNAFNPVYKVGDQIMEAILAHENISKKEARERTKELFKLVGIDESRIEGYPHEFSGGMKQRSMIAMALACSPRLILADEPTTALDVIMQDRVLAEIRDLQKRLNIAMIIITHDISVVAEVAGKIGIMYAGRMMEYGKITPIFKTPANPYTIGLLNAYPSLAKSKQKLRSIPGSPPDLVNPPSGCCFHPRCKFAKEICKEKRPEMLEVEEGHFSACHFSREIFMKSKEGGLLE